jgi:hypothetical protein
MPCNLVEVYRRFRDISPPSSDLKNMPSKKQQEGVNLFFDPEDGVDGFLRNAGALVPKCTEFESRRSCIPFIVLLYLNRGQFISFDAVCYERVVK